MQRSVKLADDARKAFLASPSSDEVDSAGKRKKREVSVALSLGPFGSTVQPPQDFDGFYPPPFGPKGPSSTDVPGNTRLFSPSPASDGPGRSVTATLKEEEENAIEALARFHLWRLRAVRSNPETWNAIDYVAFETVPHLRELRAIKIAMARFHDDLLSPSAGGSKEKKSLKGWWISLVFLNGAECAQWGPEERRHQTQSLLGLAENLTGNDDGGGGEILTVVLDEQLGAVPTGLGINCTRIDQYLSILSSILSPSNFASREKNPGAGDDEDEKGARQRVPLTLVVYPNGGRAGDTFDGLTYRWVNDGNPRPGGRDITWEEEVVEIVQNCRSDWKDVIVGGCCRVDPLQIKKLRERVNEAL